MLPIPAKKCWSSKSGLIDRFRARNISWNLAGVKSGSFGSGPNSENKLLVSLRSHTLPNFRGSLKLRRQPEVKSRARRSCFAMGFSEGSTFRSPLIRRWITNVDSESVSVRNLALLPTSCTDCPRSTAWKVSMSGSASVRGQSRRALMILCPINDGAPAVPRLKFRAMVSTSGSSGTSLTH